MYLLLNMHKTQEQLFLWATSTAAETNNSLILSGATTAWRISLQHCAVIDMLKICSAVGMAWELQQRWISPLWGQRAALLGCHTQYSQPKSQSHLSKCLRLHLLLISAWDEDVWEEWTLQSPVISQQLKLPTMLKATWIRVLTLAMEYLYEQMQLES